MAPTSKGQRSRSQRNVTYPGKIVITQYWVVVSSSYLEANMRKTPTSAAQNGCHSNDGWLATGPLNLQFMM